MCVVSAMGDFYERRLPNTYPWVMPNVYPQPQPYTAPNTNQIPMRFPEGPTQKDFDALKKELEEIKEILTVAKKYDEDNGEPDCEVEAKTRVLWAFADAAGVDLTDVLGPRPEPKES